MAEAIWTIGHSIRPAGAFVSVLGAHRIEALVDVRRFPGSRRLPQFNAGALESFLSAHGIAYHWIEALGGRRRPEPGSANTGWRELAFRGYADHLASDEFAEGLFDLLMIAGGLRTAIMCAEMLWWQCHRRLIADVLTAQGFEVIHLRDEKPGDLHTLKDPVRLIDGALSYAAG